MTLGKLTRLNADRTHQSTTASLQITRQHLKKTGVFESSKIPKRLQQIKSDSCCKRIRTWTTGEDGNPLHSYRKAVAGTRDRRLHTSVLLVFILEIYDSLTTQDGKASEFYQQRQSFPQIVVRHMTQKITAKKQAIEQLRVLVSSVQYMSPTNLRIRMFESLCGLNSTSFNPPEKAQLFLRLVRKFHRLKLASLGSRNSDMGVASLVFYNVGLSRLAVVLMVQDLFIYDPIWTFEYLSTECTELKVDRRWEPKMLTVLLDQIEKVKATGANAQLKLNIDEVLEAVITTWCNRAKVLYKELSAAADKEDALVRDHLAIHVAKYANVPLVAPLTPSESVLLDEILFKYWKAPIAWQQEFDANRARLHPERGLEQLKDYYAEYLRKYEEETDPKVWEWERWPWDIDWEWTKLDPFDPALTPEEEEAQKKAHEELLAKKPRLKNKKSSLANVLSFIRQAKKKPTVCLKLAHYHLGDRVAQRVVQQLSKQTVDRMQFDILDVQGNDIQARGCTNLMQVLRERELYLTELHLGNNKIGLQGARALGAYLQMDKCKVVALDISNNQLRDRGAKALVVAATMNKSLRRLNFSRNELHGSPELEALVCKNASIQALDLSWNNLRMAKALGFAKALRDNYMIEELNLEFNAFADEGLTAIFAALQVNITLTKLNIGYNRLQGTNCEKQAHMLASSSLTELILDGNMIKASGVDTFSKLCPTVSISFKACAAHIPEQVSDEDQDAESVDQFDPSMPISTN